MSDYQELIKSFQKSRNYVRDFLIYGFKSRDDFSQKSGRTYDNERRRIESWLHEYIHASYTPQGKTLSLALDSNLLHTNPLYRVWKSRSFTDNDIMLHFFFLSLFHSEDTTYTAEDLTNHILDNYQVLFEAQLVRKKANEYVKEGILSSHRDGRRKLYRRTKTLQEALPTLFPLLLLAVSFCQLTMPLGFVGSTILDNQRVANYIFLVKHGYYGFTLEDEILFSLLSAIHTHHMVTVLNRSNRTSYTKEEQFTIVPYKIFVSTRTGRRFLCGYLPARQRFSTLRLDQIQKVTLLEPFEDYLFFQEKLEKNIPFCFGVSFGISHHMDQIRLTLFIQEGIEDYILTRLRREGRGGTITHIEKNTYSYEISVFDGNELMPFIKTFIGRILSFETNNAFLRRKFYQDIDEMAKMYQIIKE